MVCACRVLINLDAVRHNFEIARRYAPHSRIVAVVKGDAYGHGAVRVSQALELADAFGVAGLAEAIELREAGINRPILLLQGFLESAELSEIVAKELQTVIHSEQQLAALLETRLAHPLIVWLKIDTGMHRLGFPGHQLQRVLDKLQASDNVAGIVLMSHFAVSDEPANLFTEIQLKRFQEITAGSDLPRSLANSAAILAWPETRSEWIRPGYMLYGNSPFVDDKDSDDYGLQPAMSLCSEVIALREIAPGESVGYGCSWRAERPTRIATVVAGYGDGYPMQAPAGTPVLIAGQRAPLAGRVSMDMITVDVTELPSTAVGDEVLLWGPGLSVNEVAAHVGSIGYELLTRLPRRVPRIYT